MKNSTRPSDGFLYQMIGSKFEIKMKTMATIHKKVWREYFEKIISGQKKLELRLADFEINEGDTLVLEE